MPNTPIGLKKPSVRLFARFSCMPEANLFLMFTQRLNSLGVAYMVSGSSGTPGVTSSLPAKEVNEQPCYEMSRRTQMRLVAGFPRCMVFPLERSVMVSSYSRFSTSTVVDGRKCSPSRNSRNCASFS